MYRNLAMITQIVPSLDTHHAMQVFHAIWLIDEHGDHPAPYMLASAEDIESRRWRMNPAVATVIRSQPTVVVKQQPGRLAGAEDAVVDRLVDDHGRRSVDHREL